MAELGSRVALARVRAPTRRCVTLAPRAASRSLPCPRESWTLRGTPRERITGQLGLPGDGGRDGCTDARMHGCMVAAKRQGPGVQVATDPALHCTLCNPAWTPRRPHGPGLRRGGTGHPPVRALRPWHRDPGGVRGPGPALNTTGGCNYLLCSRMGGPGDVALSLGTFRVRLGRGGAKDPSGKCGVWFWKTPSSLASGVSPWQGNFPELSTPAPFRPAEHHQV